MAPFNTHFLIAEKIWPTIRAMVTWPAMYNQNYYGQFCFGCIAPDVDKISPSLTQKDTHFFDRRGDYELMASHRSPAFIAQQADFLGQPFAQLCPEAQAFALGYLCHLCVDEVSKHVWRRDTWLQFREIGPGPAFAALDEAARQQIKNYPLIVEALCSSRVLRLIPRIPPTDLERIREGGCNFARAEDVEGEYLALVDLFDRPTSARRQEKFQTFRALIETARRQTYIFRLDTLVRAGLAHSRRRLTELLENRPAEPAYPLLR